jgi:hypothetical protein
MDHPDFPIRLITQKTGLSAAPGWLYVKLDSAPLGPVKGYYQYQHAMRKLLFVPPHGAHF